jgi:hypothetical protein
MNTSTRTARIATAQQLRDALRRAPGDVRPNYGDTPAPVGDCGRSVDDPRGCGMKNENECKTHCSPPDDDPALLSYSGTLASRKQQLKAARRRGLER